jgi:hypothetical protein
MGLLSHLENIIKELISFVNKGIEDYFNQLDDHQQKRRVINDDDQDIDYKNNMEKIMKEYELKISSLSNNENLNEFRISNNSTNLLGNQLSFSNSNPDKSNMKNDIKRRVLTIMLNVIKFVSESFDCFRKTDAYKQINENENELSKSFASFMNSDNFLLYINNLKFSKGINKSAMIAFYSKIFTKELVVNAKTIYDCVTVHQLYVTKQRNNRKKTSINEISEIISNKLDYVNPKEIEKLIDKFNEIPVNNYNASTSIKRKSKKRLIADIEKNVNNKVVAAADDEASFISDHDDFQDSLNAGKLKKFKIISTDNDKTKDGKLGKYLLLVLMNNYI